MFDELEGSVLRKYHDEIDAFECGENIRPLSLASHRPRRALEASHRVVAVDADDQRIASVARGGEDVDVPGMKQVEYAVGEGYAILSFLSPESRFVPACNFC